MKKLKEAWAEIIEYFDLERFIIGFCLDLALAAFILGIVLTMVFDSLAYLLLWFVSIVAAAFAMGVEG